MLFATFTLSHRHRVTKKFNIWRPSCPASASIIASIICISIRGNFLRLYTYTTLLSGTILFCVYVSLFSPTCPSYQFMCTITIKTQLQPKAPAPVLAELGTKKQRRASCGLCPARSNDLHSWSGLRRPNRCSWRPEHDLSTSRS